MNNLQEVLQLRLHQLLNKQGFFSICAIDELAALLGVNPKASEHYNTLRALHCVAYSEMSTTLQANLQAMIVSCLSTRVDVGYLVNVILAEGGVQPTIEDWPVLEHNRRRLGVKR